VFNGGSEARGIYVISTFGGDARRIADGRNPVFSPDGAQIAYIGPANDRIMLVPATGGTPRELAVKHSVLNRVAWLPDGKRLLFGGSDPKASGQSFDWYAISVDGGDERSCEGAIWLSDSFDRSPPYSVSSDGVLIYVGQGDTANVYRVPFDLTQARVTGAPVPVTMAPAINFWPSASSDGAKIVFGNASSFNTNLWTLNVDAANGRVNGDPKRITSGLADRIAPFPSKDGKLLASKTNSWIRGRKSELRKRRRPLLRSSRMTANRLPTPLGRRIASPFTPCR
jgi:Tol biopolymer transport system component